jgi:hypothetical protein
MFARRLRRSTDRPGGSLARVLAAVAVVALGIGILAAVIRIDKHLWEESHGAAPRLLADIPECPENWSSFPIFEDSAPVSRTRAMPRYFRQGPDGHIYYDAPNEQLPLSGPSTSIPEFNDCQKFIRLSDPSKFDSLFAIFAAFRLEGLTDSIGWHEVAWSSSNNTVATVSTLGAVTGVAPGNVSIVATSLVNATLKLTLAVTVKPPTGQPNPNSQTPVHIASTPSLLMEVGETRQAQAEFGTTQGQLRAAATIYSYGPGYAPLGIEANFNCLYLFFDEAHQLRARMVPMDILTAPTDLCTKPMNPGAAGTDLAVRRTVVDIAGADQDTLYPPVARWDWDEHKKKHFIGIACGSGWCEIGEPPFDPPAPTAVPVSARPADQRVLRIKGWHDQQILAIEGDGNELIPSNLLGTVIPNPDLSSQPWTKTGTSGWHLAAYVSLHDLSGSSAAQVGKYTQLLNFTLASPGAALAKVNKMFYCYGTKKKCLEDPSLLKRNCETWEDRVFFNVHRWWVRVENADGVSKVFCVTRRSHPGSTIAIPATARWRWILSDDSVWTECVNGCCQSGGT